MSNKVTATTAKSIHILACPFKVDEKNIKIDKVVKAFEEYGWKQKNMDYSKEKDFLKKRENFMRYQYFTGAARDIFCRGEKGSCTVFEYGNVENYNYYIKTTGKEYILPIDEIDLHLYDCGIGILMIRLLNGIYEKIEEIKIINDYIRRVSIPFLPTDLNAFILCAEKIGIIKYTDEKAGNTERKDFEEICVTDFRDRIWEDCKLKDQAEFIEKILFHCLEKKEQSFSGINIEYYTDDRMFLMCLLRDDDLSGSMEEALEKRTEYMTERLYTLLYIDPGEESTCKDEKMKNDLLDTAIYRRWLKWGTLYGATSYSFFCITGRSENINESVVRPFLVEYTYIYSLVLAQRYAISEFSEMAGKRVTGIEKKGNIHWGKAKRLNDLHEKYVAFKNKLMIIEISPQEQGIEIYHLLQKQLMIAEEQMILDEQLQSLYEIVNTSNSARLSIWGLVVAVFTIVLEFDKITGFVQALFGWIIKIFSLFFS